MDEQDWILENIRTLLREKGTKVENVSKEIGISPGEFSKIVNGQRKDYFKYLPQIAQSLEVSFHRLVTPNQVIQNNYGSIGNSGIGQVHQPSQYYNLKLYERILEECREKDKAKDALILAEKEAKENYKRKYENCKAKLILSEQQSIEQKEGA